MNQSRAEKSVSEWKTRARKKEQKGEKRKEEDYEKEEEKVLCVSVVGTSVPEVKEQRGRERENALKEKKRDRNN